MTKLAARHGISVRLRDSDFGGVRAIALIPANLLVEVGASIQDHFVSGEYPPFRPDTTPSGTDSAGALPRRRGIRSVTAVADSDDHDIQTRGASDMLANNREVTE